MVYSILQWITEKKREPEKRKYQIAMKKEQLNSDVLQNPGGNSEVHVQISPVDEKRSEAGKDSFTSNACEHINLNAHRYQLRMVPSKFMSETFRFTFHGCSTWTCLYKNTLHPVQFGSVIQCKYPGRCTKRVDRISIKFWFKSYKFRAKQSTQKVFDKRICLL